MKKPAAVFFDLDGTLVDTAPDFVRVLNQLRSEEGLPPLPARSIRDQVSNGARALVQLGFKLEEQDPAHCRLLNRLLALYADGLAKESLVFNGLDHFLTELEHLQVPWGVVTNKPSLYTFPLLQQLGLLDRCSAVVCPDHVVNRKPHAEPMLKACELAGVSPSESWYVGDHERDIASGRSAGCITIGARWGYLADEDEPTRWQADYLLDTPAALRDFFWSADDISINSISLNQK